MSPAPPCPPYGNARGVAAALQQEQLRAHADSAGSAVAAGAAAALLVLVMLRADIAGPALAAWLAAVAVALGVRWRLARGFEATAQAAPDGPRWLWRFRAGALLHGIAWGALALLPATLADPSLLAVLFFLLAGLAAGLMTISLFDLRAGLLFAVPAVLPLGLRLLVTPNELPRLAPAGVAMTLLLLALFTKAARRAARVRRELVSTRAAEADRAEDTRRAEGLLRMAFDHVGEGISMFDREQRLVAWNARFLEDTGLDPALARVGTTLRDCLRQLALAGEYGPVDPDAEVEARLALHTIDAPAVTRRTRPDGREIEIRRSPMPDGGFVFVYLDITQRLAREAALAENQRRLALLQQTTEQGFWFIDNDLKTTEVNPAMCRMLGLERSQILGHSIFEFLDEANAAIVRDQALRRTDGQPSSYGIAVRRADGTLLHCHNNATPLFDAHGRKVGSVGLFSDISEQKRAEQQIRETGELLTQKTRVLEITLESLSQGVLSIDAQGRTNAWNRRFTELLEIPEAVMQERPTFRELTQWQLQHNHFTPGLREIGESGREEMVRFIRGEAHAIAAHYQRTKKDGTVIEVRSHFGSDDSVVRTYTDVTARVEAERALRESETRFRSMADGAPALIWLADREGQSVWFNQRWLEYTGETGAQALAGIWINRIHPDDYAPAQEVFAQAFAQQRPYDIEFRVRRADGHWAWIADNGRPRYSAGGRFEGFISYGWDITERKAAEAGLIAAKEEAERANRAKSEFLSRMSHELRTPMNAILGFGQLLQSDEQNPLAPLQRTRVREMLRGGRHLLSLINEVLDLARIEAGTLRLSLTPVALDALIDDCLRLVQPVAQARGISLQLHAPPGGAGEVMADPTRLRQVLLNLLSNAIKYNREGGRVVIECVALADAVRIEVSDDGPGIAPEQQERLFQAFERLDADHNGIEGAGIGLALSKWLVKLMHGEVGVESEPGVGSCFWVRLARSGPVTAAPATTRPVPLPAPAAEPVTAAAATRHTVLYIEDNPVNQVLMEGMLAHRPGVRLLLADLPETGLAMAEQERPDLVLLDIQLPGMDGFEVLRRLREQPAMRDVPVIAVSANAMQSDIEQARRAGFTDYVTKPLDMPLLLARVDRALALPLNP
jgi:PAS domain S-box-containing protein